MLNFCFLGVSKLGRQVLAWQRDGVDGQVADKFLQLRERGLDAGLGAHQLVAVVVNSFKLDVFKAYTKLLDDGPVLELRERKLRYFYFAFYFEQSRDVLFLLFALGSGLVHLAAGDIL